MEERYSIYCRECDEQRFLKAVTYTEINMVQYKGIAYFTCPTCFTKYEWDSGVLDHLEADDMYRLYKGAKLAGFFPDPVDQEGRWKDL